MNVRRPPDYGDPVAQAQRVIDYHAEQLRVIAELPDKALASIAFLGCHDDIVSAAYRELERRRCA